MAQDPAFPADVVFISDGQFEAAAKQLDQAADELTKSVAVFEAYIKRHNVDIPCWIKVKGWENPDGEFWRRDVGFDRFNNEWVIGVREESGLAHDPELNRTKAWRFCDAPRKSRISAAEKLMALLHELTKEMLKTSRRMSETATTTYTSAQALGLVKPAGKK